MTAPRKLRSAALIASIACLALTACTRTGPEEARLLISPTVFDLGDGKYEFAEKGYLLVPENRNNPDSATIGVHFMHFRSTAEHPAAPIFVLAGGPGGSYFPDLTEGTRGAGAPAAGAFLQRLQIFEDLRAAADVVVIDQRGAGLSFPQMDCPNHQLLGSADSLYSREARTAALQQYVRDCKKAWAELGRDLDGYHALQLADDVDDLRRLLGYAKISLFGGSFGSEWSFVTLRRHPQIVERVVVWGMEGINHTYDSPSEILTSVETILAAAEKDPGLAPLIPEGGLLKAIRARIGELGAKPVTATGKDPRTGEPVQVLIGADELRQAWRSSVGRQGAQSWPGSVLSILDGDLQAVATQVVTTHNILNGRSTGNHMAMHMAIDCGLSPSAERQAQLASDPAIEVLGDINLPYFAMCGEWQAPNIQAEWLEPLRTDIPALFVQGTWDLSTPLSNATEIAAGFSKGHLIVVEGGTHGVIGDLYREQPDVIRPLLRRFLAGESIDDAPKRLELAPVDFTAPARKPAT